MYFFGKKIFSDPLWQAGTNQCLFAIPGPAFLASKYKTSFEILLHDILSCEGMNKECQ